MKKVVVLQPQFFPWIGVFEQIRVAVVFVHLDDVPFPQGRSFTSRVQIKTAAGPRWLSAPARRRIHQPRPDQDGGRPPLAERPGQTAQRPVDP